MIDSKNISVVVQGGLNGEQTKKCLESIRKWLPKAEIILSTWENSDLLYINGLYDKLVLSKDPGAIIFDENLKKTNNINRIIISSKKGIELCQKEYTLLIRNDMLMLNNNILNFHDKLKRNEKCCLFKKRIFSYEMFSLRFETVNRKKLYTIFHISDWCRFGLTTDIRELFSVSKVKEPQFSEYFCSHTQNLDIDIWQERKWKFSPEQYIALENAKKIYHNISVKNRLDIRKKVIKVSDEFIVNNFLIKSIQDWGIICQKNIYKNRTIKDSSYTCLGAWLGLNFKLAYKKYCDKKYKISLKDIFLVCVNNKYTPKIKKHFNNFIYPVKRFVFYVKKYIFYPINKVIRWICEPLSISFYIFKWFIKTVKILYSFTFE